MTSLQAKLITRVLLDPEFQNALADVVNETHSAAKTALNEATIESLFERILYALLKQIGLTFSPEKESAIATKLHIGKG